MPLPTHSALLVAWMINQRLSLLLLLVTRC